MEPARLPRGIGRWDLTAGIVNGVIGAGIFGSPSVVAGLTGAWSPLAFVLAALGILTVVLCFAEVGSRFDEAGGPYLYTREALGAEVGFQVGWLHVWTRLLSGAAVLNVFVSYLGQVMPWALTPGGRATVITTVVVLITAVNVWGLRQAVWAQNAFTLAKLLPLAALIVLGLPHIRPEVLASQAVAAPHWADAILMLVFVYGGFESGIVAGSETREPRRDTGFALVTSLAVVTLVYCLLQLVVVGVLPRARDSSAPVASALTVLLGPAGAVAGSLAALVSGYGWLSGFALMSPRILYSMGERSDLPVSLSRVHPRLRTPHVAIVVNSVAALALALGGTFAGAANLSVVTRLVIYVLVCVALPVLRVRRPSEDPGFRLRAAWPVVGAAILFCAWLLATRSYAQIWMFLAIMAGGWALRWVSARSGARAIQPS